MTTSNDLIIETKNNQIPLPHPDHEQLVDCLRLREALIKIDELVNELGQDASIPIAKLRRELDELKPVVARLDEYFIFNEYVPSAIQITYKADGKNVNHTTEIINGQSRTTNYHYDDAGKIIKYVSNFLDIERTFSLNYDPNNGQLINITSEISGGQK